MQNRPKKICNAESFSEISAKTIDYKVGDAYPIALLTKAVTLYSRCIIGIGDDRNAAQ
jgi:hypothetical protein